MLNVEIEFLNFKNVYPPASINHSLANVEFYCFRRKFTNTEILMSNLLPLASNLLGLLKSVITFGASDKVRRLSTKRWRQFLLHLNLALVDG